MAKLISLVLIVALYGVLACTFLTSTSALRPLRTANLNVLPGTKVIDELSRARSKLLNAALNVFSATTHRAHLHQDQAAKSNEVDEDDDLSFDDDQGGSCSHFENGDSETITRCERMLGDYSPTRNKDRKYP